ncbi:MAG: ribonuclease III domain-containing protein [Dokdonella sp.]
MLEQALTHRSAGRRNNERLEFLGDALLNLIVAEFVYEQYPRASEGDMTRLRAALVNGSALAELAREEELGESLVLGPGELKTGGYRRGVDSCGYLQALIAAVYLKIRTGLPAGRWCGDCSAAEIARRGRQGGQGPENNVAGTVAGQRAGPAGL